MGCQNIDIGIHGYESSQSKPRCITADDVEEFKSTSEEFRQAIAELLREEADMAQMYLTDTENGKPHTVGDDDEIELLLEV